MQDQNRNAGQPGEVEEPKSDARGAARSSWLPLGICAAAVLGGIGIFQMGGVVADFLLAQVSLTVERTPAKKPGVRQSISQVKDFELRTDLAAAKGEAITYDGILYPLTAMIAPKDMAYRFSTSQGNYLPSALVCAKQNSGATVTIPAYFWEGVMTISDDLDTRAWAMRENPCLRFTRFVDQILPPPHANDKQMHEEQKKRAPLGKDL